MEFKNGDVVISKSMKDHFIEAVVDFETEDGKVYISEWGKNLGYPTRLVIGKDKLIHKDKKIKLTRSQLENLIIEYYGEPIDFFHLNEDGEFNFGDIVKIGYNKYMFIEYLGGNKKMKLFGTLYSNSNGNKSITNLLLLNESDLSSVLKNKDDIIKNIFGYKCERKDLCIIEDIDGTPINIE